MNRHFSCVVLASSLLLGGCHSAKVAEPLTAKLGGSDPDSQMEFWHTLAQRNLTSNDEAFHGLLLYLSDTDPASDYDGRVKELKSRGLLDVGFHQPADQAVERGILAQAIVRALKIKGGVLQRLSHDNPRYAPPSSPNQTFSGTEFLGIMGRIEDHQRGNPAEYPAAVLPGEHAQGATAPMERQPVTRPAPQPTVQPTTK